MKTKSYLTGRSKLFVTFPLLALATLLGWQTAALAQGSLTPPGAPAPTMKTLAQIEPRIPISSLPITLSNSGSYYFTTNLTVSSDVIGINITTNNVTLDLEGFTLRGFGGNNNGINVQNCTNIIIRNGTITGWGNGDGIYAQGNTPGLLIEHINASGNNSGMYLNCNGFTVRDCNCTGNAYDGIYSYGNNGGPSGSIIGCLLMGNSSAGLQCNYGTVRDCQIISNSSAGMFVTFCQVNGCLVEYCGTGSISHGIDCAYSDIRNCMVQACAGAGIYDSSQSRISGCSVFDNGSYGIYTTGTTEITDCRVHNSGNHGIRAGSESKVHHCHVTSSSGYGIYVESSTVTGCTIDNSYLSGIYVNAPGCLVSGNHLYGNNSSGTVSFNAGIYLDDANNRVEDNHVVGSGVAGIVVNNSYYSGNVVIKNYVQGNGSSNYVGTASNDFGPIGSAATATSPWANISH